MTQNGGDAMTCLEIILRAVISFIGLLIWARILGKKLISHMTFFDFVAGVTYGSIGGNLIFNKSISLLVGAVGLTIFSVLVLLSDYISLKSFLGRKILDSEPQLIIASGQILLDNMKKARLTINDLQMLLRKKDVFYIDEIEFAFLETDGSLSVLKKTKYRSVLREDVNIQSMSRGIPHACIIDSNIIEENLNKIRKNRQWLENLLKQKNIQLENVLLAQIDQRDHVSFLFKKEHKAAPSHK
ncbi:DUF421 domain-containing protein [Paenibacillus sp. NPDC056579]|uniref:DUF421 domain-containing protein n=1 Tax=unclassified Paenibacillus TaxID=185978 RepID=UPI001EF8FFF7|nr:DUF421 domain-containing protein [Paenibacillus sp. H1-7]